MFMFPTEPYTLRHIQIKAYHCSLLVSGPLSDPVILKHLPYKQRLPSGVAFSVWKVIRVTDKWHKRICKC